MGQARQRAANDGATDPENFPQRFFAVVSLGVATVRSWALESGELRRIDRDCNTAQWVAGKYRVKNTAIVHNGWWQHDCTAVCHFRCIATTGYF
jgi:hypothetical protein